MARSASVIRIKGVFKHYDWGGKTFLPRLFSIDNSEGKPFAEYWMGSKLHEGIPELPYLFKVQDVAQMLSIQVHPDKASAARKYAEENSKGIPLTAPHRNFRDDNHKPELLSPLSTFYLLHGFRPPDKMEAVLRGTGELRALLPEFLDRGYKGLYSKVMNMPQDEVNRWLQPLIGRITQKYQAGALSREDPDFWAARAALAFGRDGNVDRGLFSIYLFNIVRLEEGEALFQDAGLPHAYLEGHTMEIMANSDNVLRGGLTSKHIDVPELLAHTRFEATVPAITGGAALADREEIFHTPASDFQLSRIALTGSSALEVSSDHTDIYFVYQGAGRFNTGIGEVDFRAGEAFAVSPGMMTLHADGHSVLYRATVPPRQNKKTQVAG